MFKGLIIVGALASLGLAEPALAQTCAAYPNALANGTIADANQVMANFNCAALVGAPTFNGSAVFGAARTYFRGYDGSNNHWFGTSTAAEPTGLWLRITDNPSTNAVTAVDIAPNATQGLIVMSSGYVGVYNSSPTDYLDVGAAVVFGGTGGERISLSGGSLGFNRKVATGTIYNTSIYAYQWQHYGSATQASDILELQVYNPSGNAVTDTAIVANGLGDVGVNSVPLSGYNFYVNGPAGGSAGFTNTSDARLKTNVREITDALDLVERLRGVRFDWRAPEAREVGKDLKLPVGEPQIGFIAQEVEKVAPEAVSAPKAGSDGIYGVKDGSLVPILVEAVKEQQAEIKTLREEVAALKAAQSAAK